LGVLGEENEQNVKFPKRLRYKGKGKVLATIYKRPDCYRVYWRARVDGKPKSLFKEFTSYAACKREADKIVTGLAKGSQASALSPGQAADALAALQRLQRHYVETGKRVSLLTGISLYCDADAKLNGHGFTEAVDGFLTTVAVVKRIDLNKAVEDFIEHRKAKTVAREGKRPALSPEHHYNTSLWLRAFAKTFPGHCVCDLTKDLLNAYVAKQAKASPKTRNEKRGVVKMFLAWCVEEDYLAPNHRLLEANGLKHEAADPEEIECYTVDELRAMLERATRQPAPKDDGEPETDYRDLLPVISLAGLGGIRFKEITRLTWEDVWRVPGHIEIKAFKSKTRSRRLVTICDALAQWLARRQEHAGPVWPKGYDMLHEDFASLRKELKIKERRNGLRHSFISAHFAAHCDENLTAALAGNTPAVIHKHYKGLMTKAEGESWFAIKPVKPANVIPFKAEQA
jgi:integrase